MSKTTFKAAMAGTLLVAVAAAVTYVALSRGGDVAGSHQVNAQSAAMPTREFDGAAAFRWLERICQLGPRPSGSPGMLAQRKMLVEHFQQLGGQVTLQTFDIRHPEDGSRVSLANVIARWHPERPERILLCAHYDTRPFPDADPDPGRRRGRFIGANDGASGVAVLCQLAHHLPQLNIRFGVDLVLFDGEEFIFDNRRDPYFLGSTHFARQYAASDKQPRYRYGVLLDMVGDRDLNLYMERYSLKYARPLVQDIWRTARQLGVRAFIPRSRHQVRDDHLPLNQIAKIPTCDIIDFDYPRPGSRLSYWHTEADTPDKCSAESLGTVGRVLLQWLKQVE